MSNRLTSLARGPRIAPRLAILCGIAFLALSIAGLRAQVPEWVWHENAGRAPADNEVRFFRGHFTIDAQPSRAVLTAAGDDQATIWLNGIPVATNRAWNQAVTVDATRAVKQGENLIAIRGQNQSGDAAVIARLELTLPEDQKRTVITDTNWVSSDTESPQWFAPDFKPEGWTPVVSRGKLGVMPWGDVMAPKVATPAEKITVPPGFKIELLHSSQPGEGSWIAMTVDHKGRLIVSPQDNNDPLLRFTIGEEGKVEKIEPIALRLRHAMGLLYAHNSLYVNGHGPKGTGLYRLIDANDNDQFEEDEIRLLKNFRGEGEHGYHAVVLGPDNMIYVMNGNFTRLPEGLSPESPHRNYGEDHLLPRQWDGGGHAVNILAPGGYIVRTDPDGKNWELLLAGFRNSYDFDFNQDGEMFTFDSDMEWDWGTPWYRPTRINHCVIGGEYGWRSGTGKWPDYYPDSLPTTVDVGLGSPTGVKFGTGARFPAKYQRALFAMDWSYGRIVAIHLTPQGATYTGVYEDFVKGRPLNVTDLEVGKDGALYFLTGGRGTQAGLYRVSYHGDEDTSPAGPLVDRKASEARALRHKLEAFHGKRNPAAIDFAWPHLNSPDRWIRYAARIAIESQEVALWRDRALAENRPTAAINALLALARIGGKETQNDLLRALAKFPLATLSEEQKLEKLRVISLSFIRQGRPDTEVVKMAIEKLSPHYPSTSEWLNRELSQLLIYIGAPDVVPKTLALLRAAPTQEEKIHYIFHLRHLNLAWTPEQRERYLAEYFDWFNQDAKTRQTWQHPPDLIRWFKEVDRNYTDGASFVKFLANFKKEAESHLTPEERERLAPVLAGQKVAPKPVAAPRTFVKAWTMAELEPLLPQVGSGRSFEKGKEAFAATQCLACHKFGDEGGGVGPDITTISARFTRRDLLESIIDPSKVVSEQYLDTIVVLKDETEYTGRVIDENDQKLVLSINPLDPQRVEIAKKDIAKREASTISSMPEGLVNVLTKEEILDLLAYMESGGQKNHPAFK
jgi:putative heme-binding domain-containing protein